MNYRYTPDHQNGYTQAPYNPIYQGAPRRNYQPRKRSGAKLKQEGRNGKPVISGWRKSRGRFYTFVATMNGASHLNRKDGKDIKNSKGQQYVRWTATVTNHTDMRTSKVSCLYNLETKKLYFPEFNLVANPHANNGGYWGRSGKPKN